MSSLTLPRWFSSRRSHKKNGDVKDRDNQDRFGSLDRRKDAAKLVDEDELESVGHTYENAAFMATPTLGVEEANRKAEGGGFMMTPVAAPTHEDILRARHNLRKTLSVPDALHKGRNSRRDEHREYMNVMAKYKTRRSPRDALPRTPNEYQDSRVATVTPRRRLAGSSGEESLGFGSLTSLEDDKKQSLPQYGFPAWSLSSSLCPSDPPNAASILGLVRSNLNVDIEEEDENNDPFEESEVAQGAKESLAPQMDDRPIPGDVDEDNDELFRCWSSNGPSFTPPPLPEQGMQGFSWFPHLHAISQWEKDYFLHPLHSTLLLR